MSTLESLERDLIGCGVPLSDVGALGDRYARALETGAHADWIELYVGIFATLRRSLQHGAAPSSAALKRMLLLINDDLGSLLFDEQARDELHVAARYSIRSSIETLYRNRNLCHSSGSVLRLI